MRRRTITTALAAALTTGALNTAVHAEPGAEGARRRTGSHDLGEGQKPQLLRPGTSLYPRAIRLQHGPCGDGQLLASVVTFDGPSGTGAIMESTDGGATFTQISSVGDDATRGGEGLCCATLYELPRPVGPLPAGTLLWAASVGADVKPERRMSIRVWASPDAGHTWERLAITHTAPNPGGLWEPEFAVTEDGELIMWFCDETDGEKHSQKIVHQRSTDGRSWSAPADTIALSPPSARPGMPSVRQLPDGHWVMSYEVCGPDHHCRVFLRLFADPRDTGPVDRLDEQVQATDGTEPRHTPTLMIDDDGSALLAAQMMYRGSSDQVDETNGHVVLRTRNLRSGACWALRKAPVPVKDPWDNYCPNYSPTLVRTDAGDLVEITTAPNADGVCEGWYGSQR